MVMSRKTYQSSSKGSEQSQRICDHLGCEEPGEFRAPKNRANMREFYWFCLEHVREYNKSWDFYKGMNQDEIIKSQRDDVTWGRPTWPLGAGMKGRHHIHLRDGLADDLFQDGPYQSAPQEVPKECREALAVFNLTFPFAEEDLKNIYKKLAKQYHPDHKKGCKQAEERLKTINQAYSVLKKFLRS